MKQAACFPLRLKGRPLLFSFPRSESSLVPRLIFTFEKKFSLPPLSENYCFSIGFGTSTVFLFGRPVDHTIFVIMGSGYLEKLARCVFPLFTTDFVVSVFSFVHRMRSLPQKFSVQETFVRDHAPPFPFHESHFFPFFDGFFSLPRTYFCE